MELANLQCPVCGSPIPGDGIHADLGVARCPACKTVYDLIGRKAPARAPAAPVPAPRPKVRLPSKFEVDDRGHDGLRVSWRWFSRGVFGLLAFWLVWCSVVVFMNWDAPKELALNPCSIPFASLAVLLTYVTIAYFVNRTDIEVSRARLTIRHGPIPWTGNLDIPARELTQLYSTENPRGKNSTKTFYALNAIDHRGSKYKLLDGIDEIQQALWLEQTIEERLGIVDKPVDGEIANRSA